MIQNGSLKRQYDEFEVLYLDDVLKCCKEVSDDKIQKADRYEGLNDFYYEHNLTNDDLIHIIRDLKREDYFQGPLEDDNEDRKHVLWVFKKIVIGIYCYIKIKIINKRRTIIYISLHEDK